MLLLKTKQELLNSSVKLEEAQAEATAKTNKQTSAAIEAIKYVNKLNEQSLTIAEKRDKATKEYLKNLDVIRKSDPENPILKEENVKKTLNWINDQFKEPEKRAKAYVDGAGLQMLMRLREQEAALREQLTTSGKLGSSQQELAKFEQQIADIKEKKTLTTQQKAYWQSKTRSAINSIKTLPLSKSLH